MAVFFLLGLCAPGARSQNALGLPESNYNLTPERAFLGYRGTCESDPEVGLGVRVIEVTEGESAQRAGLQVGDFIFKINDEKISFSNDLEMIIQMGRYSAGEKLKLDVKRNDSHTAVIFTPGRSPQEFLERLKTWIDAANARLNEGLPLYCVEECQADISQGQRWSIFQRSLRGREVILKIARRTAGESGIEVDMEPAVELPFGRLSSVDLNPQFASLAKGLRQGDSFQLRVSCDLEGNFCEVRTVGLFPDYLREFLLTNP